MTRITNAMMTNTTLKHINRNMRNLDEIIRQIETTQRIQRPSDDPIRASRSMKFRTNIAENEQFHRNVLNGMAWMNVTESAFNNINSELIRTIRELAVQGATDTLTVTQKQGLVRQMQTLFQQIGHEMNATYAGSHLFSGFRTDEPPVFNRDNNRSFLITQQFNTSDISRRQSFQRLANSDGLVEPHVEYINVINLAFRGLDTGSLGAVIPPATWQASVPNPPGIHIPGFQVHKFSINDPAAYRPPDPLTTPPVRILHLIHETGELVMHDSIAQSFPREGVSVTYQKTGFRQGEINPAVYFTAREVITDPGFTPIDNVDVTYRVTQNFSRQAGAPLLDGSTSFTLAHPAAHALNAGGVFTDGAEGLVPTFNPPMPSRQLPPGVTLVGNVLTVPPGFFDTNSDFSITYSVVNPAPVAGVTLPPGAPPHSSIMHDTRVQGVELVRAVSTAPVVTPPALPVNGFANGTNIPLDRVINQRSFDMRDQNITLEFSAHTHVPINSLAKNVLTDKMFADFRRLFEFSDSLVISDRAVLRQHFEGPPHHLSGEELDRAITDQETHEEGKARAALYAKFNNMLFLVDRHADSAAREQTLLGSRMVRLDLLQSRLEQDAVTFELLTRDNDATDIPLALIKKASAEAAFMASLRANSGVVQMSLAQFIS